MDRDNLVGEIRDDYYGSDYIYNPISSVIDLTRYVAEALGEHGSDDLAEIVVDYLLAQENRPDWDADWGGWLCRIDFWNIVADELG